MSTVRPVSDAPFQIVIPHGLQTPMSTVGLPHLDSGSLPVRPWTLVVQRFTGTSEPEVDDSTTTLVGPQTWTFPIESRIPTLSVEPWSKVSPPETQSQVFFQFKSEMRGRGYTSYRGRCETTDPNLFFTTPIIL